MEQTAGLILAAGLATRFGGSKLLAPIGGRPMLQHVLDLAARAQLSPLVVVMGADAADLEAACEWRAEQRVVNPVPESGLASSVRLGLDALEGTDARRVVVLLGDQPVLRDDQLDTVLRAAGAIVVPAFGGVPGNPVVIDRSVWPLAASLHGDRGFSQLIAAQPELVTYVSVSGTNPDIDTSADLEAITRA